MTYFPSLPAPKKCSLCGRAHSGACDHKAPLAPLPGGDPRDGAFDSSMIPMDGRSEKFANLCVQAAVAVLRAELDDTILIKKTRRNK